MEISRFSMQPLGHVVSIMVKALTSLINSCWEFYFLEQMAGLCAYTVITL